MYIFHTKFLIWMLRCYNLQIIDLDVNPNVHKGSITQSQCHLVPRKIYEFNNTALPNQYSTSIQHLFNRKIMKNWFEN